MPVMLIEQWYLLPAISVRNIERDSTGRDQT
jgi:hypothetical protein